VKNGEASAEGTKFEEGEMWKGDGPFPLGRGLGTVPCPFHFCLIFGLKWAIFIGKNFAFRQNEGGIAQCPLFLNTPLSGFKG